ncbi:hypothetical protein PM082_012639 [Marasmius tenuissimus]|nr:hypothetical protein PM082_012639 [Marasmius tenuissimus]
MSNFLAGASNTHIQGEEITFQHVGRDVIHNYFNHGPYDLPLTKAQCRQVLESDVVLRKQLWSEQMEIVLRARNPFRNDETKAVKVTKRLFTAEVVHFGERTFTVVTFEPTQEKDTKYIEPIWRQVYDKTSTYKSPQFPQLYAWFKSDIPSFVLHDYLVNGEEFINRYRGNNTVYSYLSYTIGNAILKLRKDKKVTVSVSRRRRDWYFNLKTRSWLYDVASVSISKPSGVSSTRTAILFQMDSETRITKSKYTFNTFVSEYVLRVEWKSSVFQVPLDEPIFKQFVEVVLDLMTRVIPTFIPEDLDIPTVSFIDRQELVSGWEFVNQFHHHGIVFHYLCYTFEAAIQALCANKTVAFRLRVG